MGRNFSAKSVTTSQWSNIPILFGSFAIFTPKTKQRLQNSAQTSHKQGPARHCTPAKNKQIMVSMPSLSFVYLYTSAKILSMVATSGWSCPDVFSRSSKACLHKGTATSYRPWGKTWVNRLSGQPFYLWQNWQFWPCQISWFKTWHSSLLHMDCRGHCD